MRPEKSFQLHLFRLLEDKSTNDQIRDPSLFKFRAETTFDVWRVMFRLQEYGFCVTSMVITPDRRPRPRLPPVPVFGTGPVTVRIVRANPDGRQPYYVPVPLEEVHKVFGEVVDCHVATSTLNYAERYTGERYHPDDGTGHLEVASHVCWRPDEIGREVDVLFRVYNERRFSIEEDGSGCGVWWNLIDTVGERLIFGIPTRQAAEEIRAKAIRGELADCDWEEVRR